MKEMKSTMSAMVVTVSMVSEDLVSLRPSSAPGCVWCGIYGQEARAQRGEGDGGLTPLSALAWRLEADVYPLHVCTNYPRVTNFLAL